MQKYITLEDIPTLCCDKLIPASTVLILGPKISTKEVFVIVLGIGHKIDLEMFEKYIKEFVNENN